MATPSQPAVETVSSVSRPGESACGPCGRRNEPQVRDVVERVNISSGRGRRGKRGSTARTNGGEGKRWWERNEGEKLGVVVLCVTQLGMNE